MTIMQSLSDHQFSQGLKIFLVGDIDTFTLKVIEIQSSKCFYHVTKCVESVNAMKLLQEKKYSFDIIMMDHPFEDMKVVQLINFVKSNNLNIPVILISHDERQSAVIRGLKIGACASYARPIRHEIMKNIWQFVNWESRMVNNRNSYHTEVNIEHGNHIIRAENQIKSKDGGDELLNNSPPLKKPRVKWTEDLQSLFLNAIEVLGLEEAVPKKILELMNVSYLTRENVASHLQKYRDSQIKEGNHHHPRSNRGRPRRPPQNSQIQPQPHRRYNNYPIPLNLDSSQRCHLHQVQNPQHPRPLQVQHLSDLISFHNNPLRDHSIQKIPQHSSVVRMEQVPKTSPHDFGNTLASSKDGLVQNHNFGSNDSINNNHHYQLPTILEGINDLGVTILEGINDLGVTNQLYDDFSSLPLYDDFSSLQLTDDPYDQIDFTSELDNMNFPDDSEVDTNGAWVHYNSSHDNL